MVAMARRASPTVRAKLPTRAAAAGIRILVAAALAAFGATPAAGDGEDAGTCSHKSVCSSYLPNPSVSAKVPDINTMHVTRTATFHPFWLALPTADAVPGYLCNSGRATRLMNPSASVLVHELLGGEDGCARTDPRTGLPPLVVDVGAHIGWFTHLAASYGCRVVAIEPQPHAHPFINATLVLNGWQGRVRAVHAAVSDECGAVKMVNRHGWGNWDLTEMAALDDPAPGDPVPVVRVDDLVDEVGPRRARCRARCAAPSSAGFR